MQRSRTTRVISAASISRGSAMSTVMLTAVLPGVRRGERMRAMASEVTSPRRSTALRFAGFACVALGAVIAGVGATRERAADDSVHGTDVWEGKDVLFAAVSALLVLLAMRTSGSAATRRGLAIVLIVLGALCVALLILDAVRAEDRFGGVEGVDR